MAGAASLFSILGSAGGDSDGVDELGLASLSSFSGVARSGGEPAFCGAMPVVFHPFPTGCSVWGLARPPMLVSLVWPRIERSMGSAETDLWDSCGARGKPAHTAGGGAARSTTMPASNLVWSRDIAIGSSDALGGCVK